ncbi:MAG: acyltransferase family protein [Candidatus Limnocylindria bacterium]
MHERLNWIDWLKVLVVFGAFVFHAAQPFVLTGWLVNDTEKSVPLSLYSGFGYLFGMPLMFLLAGATTWLATQRTGVAGHRALRIRRLVVPLVLGLVILSPLQVWIATLGSGHLEDLGAFLPRYVASLRLPLSPAWFGDYGYHLWFLAFLFFDVLLVLPLLPRLRAARDAGTLSIGAFAERPAGLAALFAAILLPQLILRPLFPVYRDWADFVLWLGYFGIGVLAMADGALLAALVGRRRQFLWLIPVAAVALLPILPFGSPLDLEHDPTYAPIGLAYITWRTALCWVMVVSLVGFASVYLRARPRLLAWASGLVLPFYVLHHPVVVLVAALVVGMGIGLWAKFGLILLLSLAGTLLLCAVVMRWPAAVARRSGPLRPAAEHAGEPRP